MLACTALAGCSDDVIEGMDNQEQQVSKEPAYLSVTFSANSTSSRSTADDANNQGDQDGDAEHSGHINLGTVGENAVNNALVVIKSTQQGVAGYARLYTTNTFTDNNTPTDYGLGVLKPVSATSGSVFYTAGEPIELTANTFEVLVVANPYAGLISEFEKVLGAGTYDNAVVDALFNKITTGQYDYTTTEQPQSYNFAGDIVSFTEPDTDGNIDVKGIMMANKELPQVKLAPAESKSVDIPIERVASKITYRITEPNNVYKIEVPNPGSVIMETVEYTFGDNTKATTLNHYTYDNTSYYIVVKDDKSFDKAYTKNADYTYTEASNFTEEMFAEATPVYTYDTQEWYVKLEKYALVNLAKSVYNVRHIINGTTVVPFDKLDGNNFLYTPLWTTENNGVSGINDVTFWNATDDDFNATLYTAGAFKNITDTKVWFFNTLADVSEESDAVYTANKTWLYFNELKESYTDIDADKVISGGNTDNQDQHKNLANIGYPLAYCLENSTDIDHQTHGLSTGITFMARIFSDKSCETPIVDMYRYKGYVFSGMSNIQTAFPNDANLNNLTDDSDPTALEAAGVARYDQNTCYYYTTEIKHFDNGIYPGDIDDQGNLITQTLGNMEFAIMRNNIYSLAVTNVSVVGDPYVDPIPSTPDEVAKPKLTVEAKIMPWIVRYHDIEFK